jgi:hypothetical protein
MNIFPDHANLTNHFIGTDECGGLGSIGTESSAAIDAILALGIWLCATSHFYSELEMPAVPTASSTDLDGQLDINMASFTSPSSHLELEASDAVIEKSEPFREYLQRLSLLSSRTPIPNLRYSAHIVTSSVLHSHPSDILRLAFIKDTLEYCPFENLKASAVDWFKTEVLSSSQASNAKNLNTPTSRTEISIPVSLHVLGPHLFPNLSSLVGEPLGELWEQLKPNFSFWTASLYLFWLVRKLPLSEEELELCKAEFASAQRQFINPLKDIRTTFTRTLEKPRSGATEPFTTTDGEVDVAVLSDLEILGRALETVDS